MGEERKLYKFRWECPNERDHSEDRGVGGRMGLKWIFGRLAEVVEWIHLPYDMERWRVVVNAVKNLPGFTELVG
jgi:hypothetical protein